MWNWRHANSATMATPTAMNASDGTNVRVTSFSPKMNAPSPAKLSSTLTTSMR